MADVAICAKCGQEKELCGSCRSEGIKQPRICKDCLIDRMSTGDETINDEYWILQMIQLKDTESLDILAKQRLT